MEKVTLKVQGMSCGHCVNTIEGSVNELEGVSLVKVHLKEGTVEIEYSSNEINLETIKRTIDEQGYDVI